MKLLLAATVMDEITVINTIRDTNYAVLKACVANAASWASGKHTNRHEAFSVCRSCGFH